MYLSTLLRPPKGAPRSDRLLWLASIVFLATSGVIAFITAVPFGRSMMLLSLAFMTGIVRKSMNHNSQVGRPVQ